MSLWSCKTKFLLNASKLKEKFLKSFPCLIPGENTNLSISQRPASNSKKSALSYCQTNCMHWSVVSYIDYCSSLFHNMPEKYIARLQCIQNCLARVITKAPRFSLSIPILEQLHCRFPVKFRIHFKICTIAFPKHANIRFMPIPTTL